MQVGEVFFKDQSAGFIQKMNQKYSFRYTESYFQDPHQKPISLTLPKTQQVYQADGLFPFFFNMLPEGSNKKVICRLLKIDENDYFTLLLKIAHSETIGAVTVKEVK